MSSDIRVLLIFIAVLALGACAQSAKKAESNTIPFGTVKPEIDFSRETPGCELAAERIADNIQVGMTLADVRRLVGQPRVIVPGRWIWSPGFASDGRPMVRYKFGPADNDVPISAFSTDSFGC